MNRPNCGRCEGTHFVGMMYTVAMAGTVILITCSKCGAVAGVAPKED